MAAKDAFKELIGKKLVAVEETKNSLTLKFEKGQHEFSKGDPLYHTMTVTYGWKK